MQEKCECNNSGKFVLLLNVLMFTMIVIMMVIEALYDTWLGQAINMMWIAFIIFSAVSFIWAIGHSGITFHKEVHNALNREIETAKNTEEIIKGKEIYD